MTQREIADALGVSHVTVGNELRGKNLPGADGLQGEVEHQTPKGRAREGAEKYHGYLKMPIPERREAIAELTAEGMSNRAIADVLGVGKGTVDRDLELIAPNGAEAADLQGEDHEQIAPNGAESQEVDLPSKPEKPPARMLRLSAHDGEPFAYPEPQSKPMLKISQSS